jgi:hypothetical protein
MFDECNQESVWESLAFFTARIWDGYEHERVSDNSMLGFMFGKTSGMCFFRVVWW